MSSTAKYYAGIGSRSTPSRVMTRMTMTAARLDRLGYVLRSGGAPGADLAFQEGANAFEIFLPWRGFNGSGSPLYGVSQEAIALARRFHPAFDRMTPGAQKLIARNGYQVLGRDLATPSDFVVCWTPDGCRNGAERTPKTGGTGQAIAIAAAHGIRVYNLANEDDERDLELFLVLLGA